MVNHILGLNIIIPGEEWEISSFSSRCNCGTDLCLPGASYLTNNVVNHHDVVNNLDVVNQLDLVNQLDVVNHLDVVNNICRTFSVARTQNPWS